MRALHWSARALAVGRAAGLSLGPAWYTCATAAAAGSSFDEAARFARLGVLVSREAGDLVFTSRNLLALATVELVTGSPTGPWRTWAGSRSSNRRKPSAM